MGSPLICFVHTVGADRGLDVPLTVLLSSGGRSRWGEQCAGAASAAELVDVALDRSRLPGCCCPDGLRHLPVQEDSKKESKRAVFTRSFLDSD